MWLKQLHILLTTVYAPFHFFSTTNKTWFQRGSWAKCQLVMEHRSAFGEIQLVAGASLSGLGNQGTP